MELTTSSVRKDYISRFLFYPLLLELLSTLDRDYNKVNCYFEIDYAYYRADSIRFSSSYYSSY